MATTPAPQAASRVSSGRRLIFGKPTDDGKVKGVRLRGVRSFGNGGAGAGGACGRRVAVEAVNGAVMPNGAKAVPDVRQVPAPPPASVEGDDSDAFRLGKFVEGRLVYRQQFVIRSYEIGPDRTATMETLMNLLQVHAKTHLFSLNPLLHVYMHLNLTVCV